MRDYFVHPAQTNLELYAQAIERDYGPAQRRMLGDAYQFALAQVFPLARGSGKPFIAHLVGTASLLLESGCSEDRVLGGLLHALYQRRVTFTGGLQPDERRGVVAQQFGSVVDDIVARYTEFESTDLSHCPEHIVVSQPDILSLRLADELEDLCGNALALHGDTSLDSRGLPGSYPGRRDSKMRQRVVLVDLARRLELTGIARGLEHWLDFQSVPPELAEMRTGWLSSVDLRAGDSDAFTRSEGP